MTEPHPRTELDQPRGLRRRRGVRPDPEFLRGAPQERGVADRLGRRRQQESPCRLRKSCRLRRRRSSTGLVTGSQPGSPSPPARAAAAHSRENSTSASGLPRDSATIRSRTRASSRPVPAIEEGLRIVGGQARDHQLGKPRQLRLRGGLAHREHQADGTRREPARNERERLRRGPIEQLRIIDDAESGRSWATSASKPRTAKPSEKPLGRLPGASDRKPG